MSSGNQESVKVVLIDTRYVETDAMSFKSVVQELTGKESCVAWIKERSSSSVGKPKKRKTSVVQVMSEDDKLFYCNSETYQNGSVPYLSKGGNDGSMSFKDMDRFTMDQLPSPDDLQWLWT